MSEIIDDEIRRLVIFCVLMQNGEGIISKHPDYIKEKYYTVMNAPFPENGLHPSVKYKYEAWLKKWGKAK